MKTLLVSLLLFVVGVAAQAQIKCRSVTNYYGTRVVLTEIVGSAIQNPSVGDTYIVAGRRSYPLLAHKVDIEDGVATIDLMFARIKDLSNLTLFISFNDEDNVLDISGTGSYDSDHPRSRDYRAAVSQLVR